MTRGKEDGHFSYRLDISQYDKNLGVLKLFSYKGKTEHPIWKMTQNFCDFSSTVCSESRASVLFHRNECKTFARDYFNIPSYLFRPFIYTLAYIHEGERAIISTFDSAVDVVVVVDGKNGQSIWKYLHDKYVYPATEILLLQLIEIKRKNLVLLGGIQNALARFRRKFPMRINFLSGSLGRLYRTTRFYEILAKYILPIVVLFFFSFFFFREFEYAFSCIETNDRWIVDRYLRV